ncbi:MAG: VWA domain-containing protein [Pirellulaceae bacterium]|nr:VWA domain-containing protein [Pirellulaceae bacterium]
MRATLHMVRAGASRTGSASVLIVAMMFVFVATAAITVDYAYMQLVRTELRSATDAAAKAGAEALSRTQNVDTAKNEAVRYAAANQVGGQPFRLSTNDITIGRVSASANGKWTFQSGGTPPNAVRVNSRTGEGAANSAVPLYFSQVLGTTGFTPNCQSTAGQQEVEVCLCLDRSGSMNFDMTGVDYSFPSGNPNLSNFTAWGWDWRNMLSRPHPVHSRWAALTRAVDVFFDQAGRNNPQPRAALVTWGSNYTMPITPNTFYPASSTDFALPSSGSSDWNSNSSSVRQLVGARANQPIMGGTNLSAGLDRAVAVLGGANSNQFSSKVVVLLTDGQWNDGRDPTNAAYDARAAGIIVHCVSMLTAYQPDLEEIATITGGRYYGTSNETELRAAFEEIARSLPVVLTD